MDAGVVPPQGVADRLRALRLENVRGEETRLRILVIEHHTDTREALIALLELWGHETVGASTAGEALKAVARFVPDVGVVALPLPDMDGSRLAWMLGMRLERRPFLIALSGSLGLVADGARRLLAGFDRFLVKPAHPGDLQHLLDRFARRRAVG
jgi:DNA-binding response OmpR family regulator